MKIKKGDQVQIITGKDRGKRGKVLKSIIENGKIVVEGLNIVKKHMRPKKEGEKGKIVEVSMPINVSNVMIVCPKCSKPSRIGYKIEKKNKSRMCKKCNSEI